MNQIQILFKNIFMQILLVDVIILDCMLSTVDVFLYIDHVPHLYFE